MQSPAACAAVVWLTGCLHRALLPLCAPTHKNTNTHIFFRAGGGGGGRGLFVVRYSSEQHFNDTDEWILQSGIIWGENFHFPRLLILAKMIAGMKVKPRDGMEGWEDSHLGG